MKIFNIHLKVLIGFAIAVAGIGFFLYTTYTNSQLSITDSQNIDRELKIMRLVEDLLDASQNIETSYRGYVITGDDKYLEPSKSAFSSIPNNINELIEICKNDSITYKLASNLKEELNAKIIFAQKIINLRKYGKTNEAYAMISTNRGIAIMEKIKSATDQLEKRGRLILNESNRKKEIIANETKQNFIVLSLVLLFQMTLLYLIIAGDLKKNERYQNEILKANNRILDLYDEAPCGYLSLDKNGTITEINKTALSWLGFSISELKGKKKLSDLSTESHKHNLENLLAEASLINYEIELTNSAGKNLPFLIDTKINYDNKGEIVDIRAVITDIKERKKAESKANYLATLIENTNDSIISTDKNLVIKSWNKGAQQMFGSVSTEAIGKKFYDATKLPTSHESENEMWNDLMTSGSWVSESNVLIGNNKQLFIRNSVSIFKDSNDTNFILIFIIQDISAQKQYEKTLKRFNEELQLKVVEQTEEISSIFNRISEGFVSFDNDSNVIFANDYAIKNLGYTKEQAIGLNFIQQFQNIKNPNILKLIKYAKTENKKMEFEEYSEHFKIWVHVKVYPSETGTSLFFQDITSKKEAQSKLIENEKQYRLLFQNNPIPMWVVELKNNSVLDVNQAAVDQYGFTYEEFIGKDFTTLRAPAEQLNAEKVKGYRSSDNFISGIKTHIKKNGDQIKVDILSYSMIYDGRPCRLVLCSDITEKLRSRQELENSRDQLRNLSSYLEKVREEERTSIAREIHDELGQQLTGLKMDVSWVARRLKDNDEVVTEKIQGMIQLIDDTVKTVRKIASELRPGILDDLGLIAALDWQSKEFEKRTGIKCNFKSDQLDHHFNKNISTGIFRIYQEALTNVARHANASQVDSSISVHDSNFVEITVQDNGIGIKNELSDRSTLGLIGMRERAYMMNGELQISSNEGKGTRIYLKIPYYN